MILFNILESEDSYEDLDPLSQKLENILSSYQLCFPILSYLICLIKPPLITYCVFNLK